MHALSEQREFGSYQALLTMPVGTDNPDMPALQVFRHILETHSYLHVWRRSYVKNALVYGFGADVNFSDWNESGAS